MANFPFKQKARAAIDTPSAHLPHMYRTLSKKTMFIYCDNPDCNYNCGKFHKPGLMRFPTSSVNPTIHEPSISESGPVVVPDNDNLVDDCHQPLQLNVTAATANANDPNGSRLSVSHNSEPMSPMSMASTITLDDIIASARRKTEADFQPIVLPSPTYLDDIPKSETYTKSIASRKDSQDSQANIEDLDEDYIPKLIDSDEEEGYWFNDEPPSLIIDDDLADMEELIKATQAPSDHFSNPILRGADPYKKAKKKEFDDSSSIDLSVADATPSQMIAHAQANFPMLQVPSTRGRVQYEGNL